MRYLVLQIYVHISVYTHTGFYTPYTDVPQAVRICESHNSNPSDLYGICEILNAVHRHAMELH